jgi:hypothetical protein
MLSDAHTVLTNPLENLRCELNGRGSVLFGLLHARLLADWRSALPPQRSGWLAIDDVAVQVSEKKAAVVAAFNECRADAQNAGFNRSLFEQRDERIRLDPDYIVPPAA